MSGRLAGKRAVVVGAGQTPGSTTGNGRAIAQLFATEGATLLLVDRDGGSLEETSASIGDNVFTLVCDIADDGAAEQIAKAAADRLGGLDILVNNVGRGALTDGPADRLDDDAWDAILSVNLRAMWRTIKACLPQLREDGGGAIVNISSLAGVAPSPMLAYSISKAGVNRMTQSVAIHEAARGVRCNAILPGLMDTPMAIEGVSKREGKAADQVRAERIKRVPMGRMGDATDTANAALFLASDEARFITGALLPVDGGASARVG